MIYRVLMVLLSVGMIVLGLLFCWACVELNVVRQNYAMCGVAGGMLIVLGLVAIGGIIDGIRGL